jgi:YgiT-type zinc finger domain-containing protein
MNDKIKQTCALCGADRAHSGVTDLVAGRNGIEVTIRGVPAYVCDACNDAAIPGPLAVVLSDSIEAIISAIEQHRDQAATAVGRSEPSMPR